MTFNNRLFTIAIPKQREVKKMLDDLEFNPLEIEFNLNEFILQNRERFAQLLEEMSA